VGLEQIVPIELWLFRWRVTCGNAAAHSAEARMAYKQQIGGSNPPVPTKFI
jgi:hypothetical protein